MGWLFLVIVLLLALLAWVAVTASKPFRSTLERGAVASSTLLPANRNRLQITVDGVEYDYTHHPLFQAIAPAMAQGDWGGVRRHLQKIAYGIHWPYSVTPRGLLVTIFSTRRMNEHKRQEGTEGCHL